MQSASTFSQRFGQPTIRKYKTSDTICISVETNESRVISAVELTPARSEGLDPSQLGMSFSDAAAILAELIPGSVSARPPDEIADSQVYPGIVTEVRKLAGLAVYSDYHGRGDRETMTAVRLELESSQLIDAIRKKIDMLGSADYEQYSAGEGLAVGVTYSQQREIQDVRISAEEKLLIKNDHPRLIDPRAAESLFRIIYPEVADSDAVHKTVFMSGALKRELLVYPTASVSRTFVNDGLSSITIQAK
jgi:hypothetical protein